MFCCFLCLFKTFLYKLQKCIVAKLQEQHRCRECRKKKKKKGKKKLVLFAAPSLHENLRLRLLFTFFFYRCGICDFGHWSLRSFSADHIYFARLSTNCEMRCENEARPQITLSPSLSAVLTRAMLQTPGPDGAQLVTQRESCFASATRKR